MIPPVWLKVAGAIFTVTDLKKGLDPTGFNQHEKNVVDFCRRWLGGQQQFQFHTSGSTGAAKLITFRRDQLETSAQLTIDALNLKPGQTALICLDTRFIAGAMMIVRSLVTGLNLIVKSPSSNPLESVEEQIDFVALVPIQLRTILKESFAKFNTLTTVIIGGAPLSGDLAGQLQGLPPACYATYGMTETITHIALQKLNQADRQDSFTSLPGIEVAVDERNCLTIKAPHLGAHPIVTNDVVMLLEKNRFRWMGRFDNVINSGGIKVQAEKVEVATAEILQDLNIQKRFFVTGLPDKKLGEQVALVLEGAKLEDLAEAQIKLRLTASLAQHEAPRIFLYTSKFIETTTKKTDRAKTLQQITF